MTAPDLTPGTVQVAAIDWVNDVMHVDNGPAKNGGVYARCNSAIKLSTEVVSPLTKLCPTCYPEDLPDQISGSDALDAMTSMMRTYFDPDEPDTLKLSAAQLVGYLANIAEQSGRKVRP